MKKNFFKIVFSVWIVLWLFFLVREDKDGQYRTLGELYRLKGEGRTRHVVGGDLYDFLRFCRAEIPEGSTYEIVGFDEYSIDKVRARYVLWPLKAGEGRTVFKIVYGSGDIDVPGYGTFRRYGEKGRLLVNTITP